MKASKNWFQTGFPYWCPGLEVYPGFSTTEIRFAKRTGIVISSSIAQRVSSAVIRHVHEFSFELAASQKTQGCNIQSTKQDC